MANDIIIELDDRDSKYSAQIEMAVTRAQIYEPNFPRGEIIIYEHTDHTCVEGCDELTGCQLLALIRRICDDE